MPGDRVNQPDDPSRQLLDEPMLAAAAAQCARHPRAFLATMVPAAAISALGAVTAVLVNAWSMPATLHDGAFTTTGTSTGATVTAVATALVSIFLAARAMARIVPVAAAEQLGLSRGPGPRVGARVSWSHTISIAAALGATAAVAWWGVTRLRDGSGSAAAIGIALLTVLLALDGVTRTVAAATTHGLPLVRAARHVVALRRSRPLFLLVAISLPFAAVIWGLVTLTHALPEPFGTAVLLGTVPGLALTPLTVYAIASTRAHLRATFWSAQFPDRPEPLPWTGLHGVATRAVAARPRRGSAPATAALIAAAPCVLILATVTNAPSALHIETAGLPPNEDPGLPVVFDDQVALVAGERGYLCPRGGPCTPTQPGTLPGSTPQSPSIVLMASPTTSGREVAMVYTAEHCVDWDCGQALFLATGSPMDYPDLTVSAPLATGNWRRTRLFALATSADGRYAVVAASFDSVEVAQPNLVLCDDARCATPRSYPLGTATHADLVRVAFSPDGTLWVARTDLERGEVNLAALAPDDGELQSVTSYSLRGTAHAPDGAEFLAEMRMAIGDHGAPMLLFRHPADSRLDLVTCMDQGCTEQVTTEVPIDPRDAASVDMAIDSTGRPMIASRGEDGTFLHSCDDRTCTSTRTALLTTGWPADYDIPWRDSTQPFLLLQNDRPVLVVSDLVDIATSTRSFDVLWCHDSRCGL